MKIWRSNAALSITIALFIATGFITTQCAQDEASSHIPDQVDFNFHVRPILVQNCYLCHGPDPSSRKAELRLDTYEGATALLKEGVGHAIVPGEADESEVIRRVTTEDTDVMMPPPESNLKLTAYEVAVLEKWINQGAKWKKHWAFIPPEATEPDRHEASANEIDDFIQEKLAGSGLDAAEEASKASLIRRVSYLLTGLPPTVEQLQAFLEDDSDDAYEKMVDQYLSSGGFGERWARHWLDVVRYAETRGHEFDYEIAGAWQYRDYLIRALNQDIPYDQLVREHIAGDLMKDARWNPDNGINESQIGTAFYLLGEGKHSPVDIKEEESDRIDNMIDVTSKTFQGLTVSCAKCHDHKFDPIPTADYYAMYGVMESSRLSAKPAELTYEKLENVQEVEELREGINEMLLRNVALELSQEDSPKTTDLAYAVIGDFRGETLDGWKSDGLAFGERTTLGEPVLDRAGKRVLKFDQGRASSRLYAKGIFGALRSPNFEISHDFIGVRAVGDTSTIRIVIDNFQMIQWPIYGGLEHRVEGEKWQDLIFNVGAWKGHKAYIEILPGRYDRHRYSMQPTDYVEVEYAIAYNEDWPQSVALKYEGSIARVAAMNQLLAQGQIVDEFEGLADISRQQDELIGTLKDSLFFEGLYDGFGINSPVFDRGNHLNPLENPVPRGFLSAVTDNHSFDSQGSGRMELADVMLDPANPLTSRVMVNRIWHHLFGRGLVETVDNFGLQGKLPSHPELLDYLAVKFQNEGWSIKSMVRYIVMSNTFRRATTGSDEASAVDPTNALLSHFPVRRLEAEAIRDGILAVTDELSREMYGEPVPVYLTEFMTGRGRPRESGPLDGHGRRSVYQAVRRNFMEPMMLTFDRPIPFSTFGKRNVTNVPAQSLILMNDPFVIDQAQKMAQLVLSEEPMNQEERIGFIYLRALSREPTEEELQKAGDFLQMLAQSYDLSDAAAVNSPEVWQDYCHSVFNMKEFIYLI